MTQSVHEQIGFVAAIEAEAHFFEIGLQMLRAQFVPTTAQATLEQRERGFDAVGVGLAAHVFLDSVLDHLVLEPHPPCNATVNIEFIGVQDFYVLAEILAHELFNRASCDVLGMKQSQFTIALTDSKDRTLFGSASAPSQSFPASSDIGFVNFDRSIQHRLIHFGHSCADSMAKIPRCFVASDSERALNLASRHALLGLTEQQCCDEPLGEGKVAVIEDCPGRYAKLIVTALAVKELFVGLKLYNGHLAARTFDASGPAEPNKQLAAFLVSREHGVYIN